MFDSVATIAGVITIDSPFEAPATNLGERCTVAFIKKISKVPTPLMKGKINIGEWRLLMSDNGGEDERSSAGLCYGLSLDFFPATIIV